MADEPNDSEEVEKTPEAGSEGPGGGANPPTGGGDGEGPGEPGPAINIEDEVRSSFLAYSMSVIISRALPDARDGLKPVHRRITDGCTRWRIDLQRRCVCLCRSIEEPLNVTCEKSSLRG